jgi:hypothetical protein
VGGVDGLLGGDQDLVEEEATKGGKVPVLLDRRPRTRNTKEGNEIETEEEEGLDRHLPRVAIDEETAQDLAQDLTGEDTVITAETFTRIGMGDHQTFPHLMKNRGREIETVTTTGDLIRKILDRAIIIEEAIGERRVADIDMTEEVEALRLLRRHLSRPPPLRLECHLLGCRRYPLEPEL